MKSRRIISAAALAFATACSTVMAGEVKTDLYTVVDGNKVDAETLKGFKTWRTAACDRCHGANQEGMVGPSLIESFKTLTKEQVVTTVTNGRLEKGMPSFSGSTVVMENIDHLYAYLKGRSNGDIKTSRVTGIE
jgi:mono/diheme cytochrome c family protein